MHLEHITDRLKFPFLEDVRFKGSVASQKNGLVALSFDDGPNPNATLKTLRLLNSHLSKATFFWIVDNATILKKQNPQLLQEIMDELKSGGHEIGLHSPSDFKPDLRFRLFGNLSPEKLAEAQAQLTDLVDLPVKLYRPHYFNIGPWAKFAREQGMTPVLWSPQHTAITNASIPWQVRIYSSANPGDILLFHDGVTLSRESTDVNDVLPDVLVNLKRKGLYPTKVSNIL